MRRLALVSLAACATPPARPAPATTPHPRVIARAMPARATPRPAAPDPLPTLSRAGELFLLVADGGRASCERWQVDPAGHRLVRDEGTATHEMDYRVTGGQLAIDSVSRTLANGDGSSSECSATLDVREDADALDVGGARWFRSAQGCEDARARHERVAIEPDLGCTLPATAPERVRDASRTRFEHVLAHGGTLYAIDDDDRCTPVRAVPAKTTRRDYFEGDLERRIVDGDGRHGTTAYTYEMSHGDAKITLLGPGTTWDDGSGEAFG